MFLMFISATEVEAVSSLKSFRLKGNGSGLIFMVVLLLTCISISDLFGVMIALISLTGFPSVAAVGAYFFDLSRTCTKRSLCSWSIK